MHQDHGCESNHAHYLYLSSAGGTFPPGDLRLIGDLPGLQNGLAPTGFAEEFDPRGVLGSRWGLRGFPAGRGRAHYAHQGADVAVLERALGPEDDLDRLFTIGGSGVALLTLDGAMDDSEEDTWLDPSRAGSQTGTFGEPNVTRTI